MCEYSPCLNKTKILTSVVVLFFLHCAWIPSGWAEEIPDDPLVGINAPLSGPYKDQGDDQVRAFELAIEVLNEDGGVLGKKVSYKIKDTKSDPEVAKENALGFVKDDNINLLTGGISSDVALDLSDICQQEKMLFMCPTAHSTAVTGFEGGQGQYGSQRAHRHTFRWFLNAWMTQKILTPYLIDEFGDLQDYFYIIPDNAWGKSVENALKFSTESAGCNTIGTERTHLGQEKFIQELKKAEEADPDVLMLGLFGRDLSRAMERLEQMGLEGQMQIVVPVMDVNMAREIGPELLQGVISTTNWYWQLKNKYPGSRKFVREFSSRYNKPPGFSAAGAWTVIMEWAAAVERAESFAPDKVIKELEGHEYRVLKDRETWRSWDHQAVNSVYAVKGKSKEKMENDWDLLQIVRELDGEEAVQSKIENPVMLEPLDSK
ncbi:MAG: ABC transporter substrate-binding protein [Thermodesulfobacteriota bacterium]